MPFDGENITQAHIDEAQAIARSLGRRMPGVVAEEIQSQALVTLWDLAIEWDEDLCVPFAAYVGGHLRFRLIDWMRAEYGRPESRRSTFRRSIGSLDELVHQDRGDESHHLGLADPTPGPEQVAESRAELAEAAGLISALSPFKRDCLLRLMRDETAEEVAERHGRSPATAAGSRHSIRRELRAALERDRNQLLGAECGRSAVPGERRQGAMRASRRKELNQEPALADASVTDPHHRGEH